jgi:basic membrane protein A and related proteins
MIRTRWPGGISRRGFHEVLVSLLACAAAKSAWGAAGHQTSVALLLSGVITDGGWSQLAYTGLQELKSKYGFKTAYAENITLAQMDQVARGYSDDGFDLIVGHGVEFSSTLLEVAPDYHGQRYFVTTFLPQQEVPRNIMYVNMGYFGAAYAAGVLAALISERKQAVGFIGGDDDPNQQRMKKAFIAGAQHTVAGIRALAIITGDYDNAAKGREAASILIGNGADVI